MTETLELAVAGGTPGNDGNTYTLFNSVTTYGAGTLKLTSANRLILSLKNGQGGTLKFYMSTNGGTNWDQVGGNVVVPPSGGADISGPFDYLVDQYRDVKLDWVNGGASQDPWRPSLILVCGDRAKGN